MSHFISAPVSIARATTDPLRRLEGEMKIRQDNVTRLPIISVLIGILIVVVVGAICFWAIEKFATDARLAKLLKLLVILVCLGAIVQRLMVLTY